MMKKPLRILCVDDDPIVLLKLKALFAQYGEVQTASSARQGLDCFLAANSSMLFYDVITLDIDMPGDNGLLLLEKITAEEKLYKSSLFQAPRKLMISSAASSENVRKAAELGVHGFLVKPVTRETVASKMLALGYQPLNPQQDAQSSEAGNSISSGKAS